MSGSVWLYCVVLVAVSWRSHDFGGEAYQTVVGLTYQTYHRDLILNRTSCRDFGGENNTINPQDLIGNWTAVYIWNEPDGSSQREIVINSTMIFTTSELTAEELPEYNSIFKDYPETNLKLRLLMHLLPERTRFVDMISVMVPTDDKGNLDAWIVDLKMTMKNTNMKLEALPAWIKYNTKWKKSEEFLVMMMCMPEYTGNFSMPRFNRAFVLASSSTPDEAKLQELVSKVNDQVQGLDGSRVYET